MNEELDEILAKTLEDYRLSRSEKRALGELLGGISRQQREYVRHRAFAICREELMSPTAKGVLDWLEDLIKVLDREPPAATRPASSQCYFSPEDDCPAAVTRLIGQTRHRLDVCVFTITDDRISDSLLQAHRRRIAIRIITDNDKSADRGSDVDRLQRGGIPLRVDRSGFHMHHKYAVFDRSRVLTGSYNWTRSAARHNEENFIVTSDRSVSDRFQKEFEQLWLRLA